MAYRTGASGAIVVRLVRLDNVRRKALFRVMEVRGFYDAHKQEGRQHHPCDKDPMSSYLLHYTLLRRKDNYLLQMKQCVIWYISKIFSYC